MDRCRTCVVVVALALVASWGGCSGGATMVSLHDASGEAEGSDTYLPPRADSTEGTGLEDLDLSAGDARDLPDAGDGGETDAADVPGPGSFGYPCQTNGDCVSGYCVQTADAKLCTMTCIEECPDEWQCVMLEGLGPDPVSVCVPVTPCDAPSEETCDGVDNDCDGETDEGLGTGTCGQGKCAHTVEKCLEGEAQTCDPMEGAEPEECDGLDNDCDGETDEEFPDLDKDGTADCVDGDDDGDGYGDGDDNCPQVGNPGQEDLDGDDVGDACDPDADGDAIPDAVDNCPGLKNTSQSDIDGDGLGDACDLDIDDDMVPNELDNCPMVANPEQTDTDQDAVGDACEKDKDGDGVEDAQDCAPLDPAIHSGAAEVCDGLDNDCNSGVDDGFKDSDQDGLKDCVDLDDDDDGTPDDGDCAPFDPAIHPDALEVCDKVDNDCDGQTDEELGELACGKGICFHTLAACIAGVLQTCDPMSGAIPETCDGLDNDCDGLVDEDLGWKMCGLGVCQKLLYVCKDGIEVTCDPFAGAGPEGCDGLDNDCDGQVDEELGSTSCGLGACTHTVKLCVGGVPQECNPLEGAKQEGCDGLDNDCDGDLDEDLGSTTCGLGICKHSSSNCVKGVPQVCNPLEGAKQEGCDGLDNDCDGLVDEELGSTTCGLGACTHTIANCADGKPQACDPMEGSLPETCDGLDNDCDGLVDEELGSTTCGLGACTHTITNCAGGKPQVCDPMEGSLPETCDGNDNDCDGQLDEDLGTTTCGLGACTHTIANCAGGKPQVCDPMEGSLPETCDGKDNDCDGEADEDCPFLSCKGLHAAKPALPSGPYLIDPDGAGGAEPFSVVCDMETAGGGWTTAYDDSGTWQTTQSIASGVKPIPITELLLYSGAGGGPVVQALAPGLSSLAQAFAQPWTFCNFENDFYKPLGKSTGSPTSTAYIFDDHDIAGAAHYTCSGHQVTYPTTPSGLISYAYANGNNFCDGGTCDYAAYGGIPIRKLLVR